MPCDPARTQELAATPTRLNAIDGHLQDRLINWGYAVCDAAMRKHGGYANAPAPKFPCDGGL